MGEAGRAPDELHGGCDEEGSEHDADRDEQKGAHEANHVRWRREPG